MGGSGGSSYSSKSVIDGLNATQADLDVQRYETEVSSLVNGQLADFNNRDAAAISLHLEEIKSAINSKEEIVETFRFGGSIAKHTYVDGLSDVDALLILDRQAIGGDSPADVRKYVTEQLKRRFPNTPIDEGSLAVTLRFFDATIQLVPALKRGQQLLIASETGRDWMGINPQIFARNLARANARLNGRLVPTIKLIKALTATLPDDVRPSGYHTEALALKVFREMTGDKTSKELLAQYFSEAPRLLLAPIQDPTGQSRAIDAHLGPKYGLKRRLASDALDRIGRNIRLADKIRSVEVWRQLLDIDG